VRLIADVDRSAENHCMLTWANGTRASDRPVAGGGSRSRTHSEGRAGHLHLVAGDGAAALRRAAHRRSQRSPWRSRRQDRRGEQVHWCPQEPNQTECRRKIEHSPDAPTWSARPRPPGRPVRPGGRARCAAPPSRRQPLGPRGKIGAATAPALRVATVQYLVSPSATMWARRIRRTPLAWRTC
jgi:hypothetical protein